MSGFQFAHLVFNQDDVDRIESFLTSLHNSVSHRYEEGFVPHVLCQGQRGVLLVPFKKYIGKGGFCAGPSAGHVCIASEEEFKKTTYKTCLEKLRTQMFVKDEINLEKLL